MGYYLLDHPNPYGPHYYTTRRNPLLAIVVHITAGLEDLDATDDNSAEATARYAATTDRAVSWHSGSDSDTAFDLLPASYTAFQCRNYNSSTYGHEISKRDTDWRSEPEPWRTRTLQLAGRHLGAKARALGIPLRKCTQAELDRAIANGGPPVGFIGHHTLDPTRRTDPGLVFGVGDTFPWTEFFGYAAGTTSPPDRSAYLMTVPIHFYADGVPARTVIDGCVNGWPTSTARTAFIKAWKGPQETIKFPNAAAFKSFSDSFMSGRDLDAITEALDSLLEQTLADTLYSRALLEIETREEARDTAPAPGG
jgi:hypothetical protein